LRCSTLEFDGLNAEFWGQSVCIFLWNTLIY